MQLITSIKEMQSLSKKLRAEGKSIGLVPTMGALHHGHLSLVTRSKAENDVAVVSIFVNSMQFGPKEDFKQYPRDPEGDLNKLSQSNIEAVFFPDVKEMYQEGFSTSVHVGHIGELLCGISRPGHFNGVATVVAKLFNIVTPDKSYFGQKDFQQAATIRKVVKELNFDIEIVVCPTIREADGLAMSSRNAYLNREERKAAAILFRALMLGKDLFASEGLNDAHRLKNKIAELIRSEPLAVIDYVEIVDTENLEEIRQLKAPAAICAAVKIGNTRLIDNIIVDNI